jgi:hypothetical protein
MKRVMRLRVEYLHPEYGYLLDSSEALLEIDDERPYASPDVVVANAAKAAVMHMLDMKTSAQEGGR